ncbi:MAG: PilZ domain-containing protein [bacterium]
MGKSNRRDPRVNIALAVKMSSPEGFSTYTTKNISYRGIFIVADEPLPLRRLARLTVVTETAEEIDVLGMVAHRINSADAAERGIPPGMGVQIHPVGSANNDVWRDFVTAHLERDPALRQAVHDHNLPRLKIHIKDDKILAKFVERDVPSGSLFYRSPEPHPVDAEVMLEVHHPSSGKRFMMKAKVAEVIEGGRRHRGMQIALEPFSEEKAAEFLDFSAGN